MKNKEESTVKLNIVDCAVRLYKEKGYKNVSVSDICKLSGVSRSGFYYHFKTKEEILDDYLLMSEIFVFEHLIPILSTSNCYQQFYNIFKVFMERIIEIGPEIFGLVMKRNIDMDLRLFWPSDIPMWDVYVTLIRKAQENQEIGNRMPAEYLVEAIVYLSQGLGLNWCNKKGEFDYIEACRKMIETLLLVKQTE